MFNIIDLAELHDFSVHEVKWVGQAMPELRWDDFVV
jgi:hypothetical protein